MANMQKSWVFGLTFLLLGAIAASVVQAEMVDGSIFDDEFNGTALEKWYDTYPDADPSDSVSGGFATITSTHPGSYYGKYSTIDAVDFSSASGDWWLEVKFKMTGYLDDSNEKTGSTQRKSSWMILSGDSAHSAYVEGFDLRALEHTNENHTESVYDLGWWGSNNNSGEYYIKAEVLYENLNKDQFYTLYLHRTTEGNVDIYLDGTDAADLIATKALIHDTEPSYMTLGDSASTDVGGTMVLDYVKVGELVPEPSTLALLAAGMVGLLAYAWRKRK